MKTRQPRRSNSALCKPFAARALFGGFLVRMGKRNRWSGGSFDSLGPIHRRPRHRGDDNLGILPAFFFFFFFLSVLLRIARLALFCNRTPRRGWGRCFWPAFMFACRWSRFGGPIRAARFASAFFARCPPGGGQPRLDGISLGLLASLRGGIERYQRDLGFVWDGCQWRGHGRRASL